mmetsp:Transcript_22449/g.31208  ORF Transcript_22449/g.31208 Transcript_22449/m.31208 type:complete len:437 (-) Transcript_22449:160-1470(-)|eukprot:CAMPEP_0196588104 /NCGR_PEP_ID=MMETSP1081-20130531/59594_1 /TAXON_ID=36882 /ORGANISM="Pyramimonas amylifera, Strain CCMP720" /LENGTH=436 /DNA_ID=CAMNT_0041910511 /DNA_START=294 /DNA_END=1604 /DNA_ORIENTATION=-
MNSLGGARLGGNLRPIYMSEEKQSKAKTMSLDDSDDEDEEGWGPDGKVPVPKAGDLRSLVSIQSQIQQEDKEVEKHKLAKLRWQNTKKALDELPDQKRAFIPVPNSIASWLRKHGKEVHPEITAEQHIELRECFDLIDADGSGTIDSEEIEHAFKFMGIKMPQHDLLTLKQGLDKDGDGEVDYSEFVAFMMPKLENHSLLTDANVDCARQADIPALPFPLVATAYRRRKLLEALLSNDIAARKRLTDVTHKSRQSAAKDLEQDQKRILIRRREACRKLAKKTDPITGKPISLSDGNKRDSPFSLKRGKDIFHAQGDQSPDNDKSIHQVPDRPFTHLRESHQTTPRTFSDEQLASVQYGRRSFERSGVRYRPVKNMSSLRPLARAYQSHDRNQREWWAISGRGNKGSELYQPCPPPTKFTIRTEVLRDTFPANFILR